VVRNQDKSTWCAGGILLWKKKVAIVGLGVIGEQIARKCKASDMEVIAIDIVKRKVESVDAFMALRTSSSGKDVDYLVIWLPTRRDEKLVSAKVLEP